MVALHRTASPRPDDGPYSMSYDQRNGFANGRPSIALNNSPKRYGRGSSLPRSSTSPSSNGPPAGGNKRMRVSGIESGYTEEDVATPVKSFLSSNITPRSGSRKARAESASPTSIGTPRTISTPSRPVSSAEKVPQSGDTALASNSSMLRSATPGKLSTTESRNIGIDVESSFTFRPPLVERTNSGASSNNSESTPMFFHASEAQASKQFRPSTNNLQKAWAAGSPNLRTENGPSGRSSALSNSSPTSDDQRPKFFHANESHEPKALSPRPTSSTTYNRPILQTIYSEHAAVASSPVRAPSPLKEEVLPRKSSVTRASPRRHTRLVSNGGTEIKSPDTPAYGDSSLSRRSSLNSQANHRITTHGRSSSAQSDNPSPPRKLSIATMDSNPFETARTTSALSNNSIPPYGTYASNATNDPPASPLRMQPQSPTKPQSKLDQMNELAANARRERKVLDLEISNSSLLAINRTLEREMRKQHAELRSYRRLSRSGRLSVAPSSRSASGRKSTLSNTDTDVNSDDLLSPSETEDDEHHKDGSSSKSSTSASSRPSSPLSRAARDRFHDQKTTPLDLTAQRALLLESQRLNQSIKRCLGRTEFLISSGRRALEFTVHPPEIENLGPKVLTPDEVEDDVIERGQGLLSPTIPSQGVTANPWERSLDPTATLDGGLKTPDFSNWDPLLEETSDTSNPRDETLQQLASVEDQEDDIPNDSSNVLSHEDSIATPDTGDNAFTFPAPTAETSSGKLPPPTSHKDPMPPPNHPKPIEGSSMTDEVIKAPDPSIGNANTPGNRSSMKNLGHYLQSFGIFAGGIKPP